MKIRNWESRGKHLFSIIHTLLEKGRAGLTGLSQGLIEKSVVNA